MVSSIQNTTKMSQVQNALDHLQSPYTLFPTLLLKLPHSHLPIISCLKFLLQHPFIG